MAARLSLLVALFLLIGSGEGACPSGYSSWLPGYCYRLYTQPATVVAARQQCKSDGGYLTDIYDLKENDELRHQLRLHVGCSAWIGLDCYKDQFGNPDYVWESGYDLDYNNLQCDYPCLNHPCDSSHGYCMDPISGTWVDESATDKYPFFCKMFQMDVPTTPGPPSLCGDFEQAGHSTTCIKISDQKATWLDAETACAAQNAHLISIHDAEVNGFINARVLALGFENGVHIGLSSNSSTKSVVWTDGTPFDYNHYAQGFPNDIFGHCTAMDTASSSGSWLSMDCRTSVLPYVCGRMAHSPNGTNAPPTCPENAYYTGPGELFSPSYPLGYRPGQSCEYFLAAPEGKLMAIDFDDFDTANCCSSLSLYDGVLGEELVAKLSGSVSQSQRHYRTSKTNVMRLVWKTTADGWGVRGWHARFAAV